MKFDLNKYKFIVFDKTVVAMSTYAGKTVKASAKCDPRDEFDLETGKKLAAARCNFKIAKKRHQRATEKYREAAKNADEAVKRYEEMKEYFIDSVDAVDDAMAEIRELTEILNVEK